ncbi:MAG: hypothetical protein WC162_05200 [Sphaerochaetaceae bacterium]|nr:hypothetical protein [Sphaerochaetaceae bacterium]
MKKKLVLILLVVLALSPLMAAKSFSFDKILNSDENDWGIGLNLGLPTGVVAELNSEDYDFYINLGYDYYYGFSGAVGVDYKVTEFEIEKAKFDIGIGGEIPVSVTSGFFLVKGLFTGSLSYQFEDLPLKAYARLGVGAEFNTSDGFGFGYGGGIGAIYHFE